MITLRFHLTLVTTQERMHEGDAEYQYETVACMLVSVGDHDESSGPLRRFCVQYINPSQLQLVAHCHPYQLISTLDNSCSTILQL